MANLSRSSTSKAAFARSMREVGPPSPLASTGGGAVRVRVSAPSVRAPLAPLMVRSKNAMRRSMLLTTPSVS